MGEHKTKRFCGAYLREATKRALVEMSLKLGISQSRLTEQLLEAGLGLQERNVQLAVVVRRELAKLRACTGARLHPEKGYCDCREKAAVLDEVLTRAGLGPVEHPA